MTLTNNELIAYLLQEKGGDAMKGAIRAKGHCPVCQGSFTEVKKLGFICAEHKTVPNRFYIDLFHKGQRIRLFSDKHGQAIDTYQRASSLLSHINYEIQNRTFDPTRYVKQDLEKFYVSTLLDKFLTFKIDSIAPSYKKDYRRFVQIAKDYFGGTDARELRKIDIINYREHLAKNFDFSEKTVKNILDNFKTFLNYLKSDLEILDVVPSFPVIGVPQPKITWLTQELQQKVFEVVPDDHKPIFAFLMLHGCRPSEARALKCKDIDLEHGVITISSTFSGRVFLERRKGRNSKDSTIPLHPELLPYITDRIKNNLPNAYVFVNSKTGKHYSENSLRRIWDDIREKVGLSQSIRLYDATRHSVASQLANKGIPLLNVAKLLGHSSTKMAEKYYIHTDVGRLKADIINLSLKDQTVTKPSPAEKVVL